jgi:hypothetical protein
MRRKTTWAHVLETVSIAAANGYSTIDLLQQAKADGLAQQAVTITRTHLRITWQSPAPAAGNNWYYGLVRGQSQDVGANVVGAPTPVNEPYADWLLWDYLYADNNGLFFPHHANQHVIDLKAQRRLEELQMNYNMVIGVVAAPSFPVTLQVMGRVLVTLP